MQILAGFRKRNAIASYVKRLPRLLMRDYGASHVYTPEQIKRTIERAGMNTYYSCYPISMFSDQLAFDCYHAGRGELCNYAELRAEVASLHFHGNLDFTIQNALDTVHHISGDAGHTALPGMDGGGHGGGGHGGF